MQIGTHNEILDVYNIPKILTIPNSKVVLRVVNFSISANYNNVEIEATLIPDLIENVVVDRLGQ